MCGIFGYIGKKEAVKLAVEGIKFLDYRGYDSSGVAILSEGNLFYEKRVGAVSSLEEALEKKMWKATQAVAHTRWATHGKPTHANAHPHVDTKEELAVVHNGIIENHDEIRRMLQARGIVFRSETDTEVISHLIATLYTGDFLSSVQQAVKLLKGAFAIAVIHKNHPDVMVCATHDCPLVIGLGEGETFISSDCAAFIKYTNRAIFLNSKEVAHISASGVEVFDSNHIKVTRDHEILKFASTDIGKGQYSHFMEKEIFEQPQTALYAFLSRYNEQNGTAILEDLKISDEELSKIERILIVACGTSYHAGLIAAHLIEERARIPVQVEISSEYRYKNPIVQKHTLAICISQSGETADTIAAMRELKEKGAKIIGICNVQSSTIARECDSPLFLRAGPEIGVASTKAFTSQLLVLSLLTLRLARMRTMSQQEGKDFIASFLQVPKLIKSVLDNASAIEALAQKYSKYDNFFFLGRRLMYPTALEAALKLKEIAYVNANGYPAGEMKHGPIALINEECPTIAFTADSVTYPKMLSNLMEVKARSGKILAIAEEGSAQIEDIADDIIWVPKTIDNLAPLPSTIAGQLFAYTFAKARGCEIDKPRNLAKSVTVE